LGQALIARLVRDGADRIVTLSRDEHKREALQARFGWYPGFRVYAGDVRDVGPLVDHFQGCEALIHGAARKVVSGHHDEPQEHLKTNVLGTRYVLQAARRAGVRKVLFVSSDKAVQPQNCYGVSKALAEALVISENAHAFHEGFRASVIRYGNVLASTGSVVRVWRERAAAGLPLPVSDRRMTRFWQTIEDAASVVLKALADLRGGEVFIPIMRAAPLVRVLEAIAPGAAVEEIGIRPGGEKIHESLVSEDEARRARRRNGWIVVPPPDTPHHWERWAWLGASVGEDFRYCSADWPEQWSVEELRAVLGPATGVEVSA
jgi:UDP-N-acetylglucosamine 4,6-dehydratase